jgi:PHD/YefM family antitoxin component YafN of YafNO toxin-antitoxin module
MAALNEKYVTDKKGRKTAVILSVREYQKLMEDLHDLAVVAERHDEELVPFEEVKKRLKRDGIL